MAAAVHFHRVRINHRGAAAHHLHPGRAQQTLVDRVEARDFLVLVGEQRAPFEGRLPGRPAVGLRDLELLAPVRRVGEKLLRDAADIDAGAAESARLGDGDFRAIGGRDAARAHTAGAAAYREKIEIEAYFRFFRLSSISSRSMVIRWCCGLSASHRSAFCTLFSICAFGMPSKALNMAASSGRFALCAAFRTSASLPSIALRSRLVTILTVLSSDMRRSPAMRQWPILPAHNARPPHALHRRPAAFASALSATAPPRDESVQAHRRTQGAADHRPWPAPFCRVRSRLSLRAPADA